MILTVLFYGSLAVMVLFTLLGLHCLGKVTYERDHALYGQRLLIDQNKLLYHSNQILAAQNERLIDYNVAQGSLDQEDTFTGNVFPTEG